MDDKTINRSNMVSVLLKRFPELTEEFQENLRIFGNDHADRYYVVFGLLLNPYLIQFGVSLI